GSCLPVLTASCGARRTRPARRIPSRCLQLLPATFAALFSLHVHRPRRGLHSFPTRRSSDLWLVKQVGDRSRSEWMFPSPRVSGQDRKSTRLNSSHVKISYAVFCLKKKKQKDDSNANTHEPIRPRHMWRSRG